MEWPGLVPTYDEYAAMVYANYSEVEWREIAPEARAKAVAHYRLSRIVSIHESDAVAKAAKRKSKQRGI